MKYPHSQASYDLQALNESMWNRDEYIMPGFFKRPHILLVGVNPHRCFPYHTPDEERDYANIDSAKTYDEWEQKYCENILSTQHVRALDALINMRSNYVSFTNVVKKPTPNAGHITKEMIDKYVPLTLQQISIFQPKLVVVFGSIALKWLLGESAELHQFIEKNGIMYYGVYHYSYLNRSGKDPVLYYGQQRTVIDDWLKLHAVIKVTDNFVYYRDIDGVMARYENTEESDECYVRTNDPSPIKSYRGDNLIKIPRRDLYAFNINDTFDAYVSRVARFLYNRHPSYVSEYKILLFDIETNFCNTPDNPSGEIICISTYSTEYGKKNMFYLSPSGSHEGARILHYEDEKQMLTDFLSLASSHEILAGWYSNNFDVPYVINRARRLGINVGQYFRGLYMNGVKGSYRIACENLYFIDLLEVFKKARGGTKVKSYSLDSVSKILLNQSKVKMAPHEIPELWKSDPDKLAQYSVQDTNLLVELFRVVKFDGYWQLIHQMVPENIDVTIHNSITIENMLHYYFPENIYPTKIERGTDDDVDTGVVVVMHPKPGLYHNVLVLDFSGMYSSIIDTFNISPETVRDCPTNFCIAVGKTYFDLAKPAILPKLIRFLRKIRDDAKALRDKYDATSKEYRAYDDKQGVAKTLMNSIYGVSSYRKFILYDKDVSNSIRLAGRLLVTAAVEALEKAGYETIYGDTDSVFVNLGDGRVEDVMAQLPEIKEFVNNALKQFVMSLVIGDASKAECSVKVDADKLFSHFKIGSAKKRYFGLEVVKKEKFIPQGILEVAGFETRHHSTPEYFDEVYKKIYNLILLDKQDELNTYLATIEAEIKTVPHEKLIVHLKLGKDIAAYKNNIAIVRAVKNSGSTVFRGDFINLLYTTLGEINWDGVSAVEIDYSKYIDVFITKKLKLLGIKYEATHTLALPVEG